MGNSNTKTMKSKKGQVVQTSYFITSEWNSTQEHARTDLQDSSRPVHIAHLHTHPSQ
jgi:hypothetical protein